MMAKKYVRCIDNEFVENQLEINKVYELMGYEREYALIRGVKVFPDMTGEFYAIRFKDVCFLNPNTKLI